MRRRNLVKALVLLGVCTAPVLYWAPWSDPGTAEPPAGSFEAMAQEGKPKPLGGDLVPVRRVEDPYPVFNGVAVDPDNNLVVMTDVNRKTLLVYDRNAAATNPADLTLPLRQMIGPETNLGFVAGVALDPDRREILAVNNDIEDTMVAMPYTGSGNQVPARLLAVPHQAWGVALGRSTNEMCLTVEDKNAIVFYPRDANGVPRPKRTISGPDTELADPHGVYWDERHNEVTIANHGNFKGMFKDVGSGCMPTGTADPESGEFKPPSINVYPGDAQGNRKPMRKIQGDRTQLDFPMGLSVDEAHDEIFVANNGTSSVLIFRRTATGDVAPVRVIAGSRTGVNHPMGIALDTKNDEIWVSNFGDHTAVAFSRTASGNVAPKRVIRTAPIGTPSAGFGNPQTAAYDSKRQEILVPN
jgi:DNA-binding beta-propeller fold protein YncE